MDPLAFLFIIILVTLAASAYQLTVNFRQAHALRGLAGEWSMHFAADDRFRLAPRIAGRLPVIGASDVRAWHLMYRTDSGRRGYLFTIEYGIGAIGPQRRKQCVGLLEESSTSAHGDFDFVVAPEGLPLIEQYRKLYERHAKG